MFTNNAPIIFQGWCGPTASDILSAAFPVSGEQHLEIYGGTTHGTLIHLYDREFCCK